MTGASEYQTADATGPTKHLNNHRPYQNSVTTPRTTRYRTVLLMLTRTTNMGNGTRSTPAANVSGSPIIGTQASNNDQTPNRLKYSLARSSWVWETGNQRRSCQCRQNRPIIQLTTAPRMFPTLADNNKIQTLNDADAIIPPSRSSEENGTIVAASKALRNSPR